jgi:hypothetical protein
MPYEEEPSKPLTFTDGTKKDSDGTKKDEAEIRADFNKGEDRLKKMGSPTNPVLPDAVNLKHAKPAFTEAIDSMFNAVAKLLKQLTPSEKNQSRDKNKPS